MASSIIPVNNPAAVGADRLAETAEVVWRLTTREDDPHFVYTLWYIAISSCLMVRVAVGSGQG